MPEQMNHPSHGPQEIREAVRIHTNQIEDACIDKDCIEDLRVYLTEPAQNALNAAPGARARSAELLHVYIDVSEIAYKPGHYAADLTFLYRIWGETVNPPARPVPLEGLAVFSKRLVLFGGISDARVFSSACTGFSPESVYRKAVPDCVVEAVDPMVLSTKLVEIRPEDPVMPLPEIPIPVESLFEAPLALQNCPKQLLVTLGQFSTVRLERGAQLVIPAYEYSVPQKTCSDDPGTPDEPCDLFARVEFPTQAFFPRREESKTGPQS